MGRKQRLAEMLGAERREAVAYDHVVSLLGDAEREISKVKKDAKAKDSSMAHRPLRNAIQALLRVAAELGTKDVTRGIPANLKGVL